MKRAAYQGEPGSFSSEVVNRFYNGSAKGIPCETFDKMFASVINDEADCCIAPIENSLFGSVHQNYDLLLKHNLRIVGETELRIVHNLMALPGAVFNDVKRVYSHPVALGQCKNFFSDHPHIEQVVAYDTAGSVKMIMAEREKSSAAIASLNAAKVYGANVLMEGIEDNPLNYTRFLLLERSDAEAPPSSGADKTSIVFSLENKAGSLYRAMAVFALRDIDLTKIESRPLIGRPWEYCFYLDFIGNTTDTNVRNALAHLSEFAADLRILGCYKKST